MLVLGEFDRILLVYLNERVLIDRLTCIRSIEKVVIDPTPIVLLHSRRRAFINLFIPTVNRIVPFSLYL